MPSNLSGKTGIALIVILIGLMVASAWLVPTFGLQWWMWIWFGNILLMMVIMAVIGISSGKKTGAFSILVDGNRISLSRFQITMWTLLVLSAFWTVAIARAADSRNEAHKDNYVCITPESTADDETPPQPMTADGDPCAAPADLQLPAELWALLGISVTSAVAAPIIRENKKQRTSNGANYVVEPEAAAEFEAVGAVAVAKPDRDPKFTDMFMSEDANSTTHVDMSKVQNFFFTIVAVFVYGVTLAAAISGASSFAALFQFPFLSNGLIAILGISHAGYLVNKNTTSAPTPTT